MRVMVDILSVEITDIETWRLMQLCAERAENIRELETLANLFRQRVAAKEEHSEIFRDNLAAIVDSIQDMEDSCDQWQREIDAMTAELKRRGGGGGMVTTLPAWFEPSTIITGAFGCI